MSLINIALLQEGRVKARCIHPSITSNSSLEFPLFLSELEGTQVFGAIENCDSKYLHCYALGGLAIVLL